MTTELIAAAFTIYGIPRTKKNSGRIVRTGGYPRLLPSKAWEQYSKTCVFTSRPKLDDRPYNVTALVFRDAERGDAVGFYQSLADLLELNGVVSNDKWLVSWDGSRLMKDANQPRVEVTITRAD